MDDSITNFCNTLSSLCKQLESSCCSLKEASSRNAVPLDSSAPTFFQCLHRRVSAAEFDLNVLESMAFGTISFEELLGHCTEIYKKNQGDIKQLQDHLNFFGHDSHQIADEENDMYVPFSPVAANSEVKSAENRNGEPSYASELSSTQTSSKDDQYPLFAHHSFSEIEPCKNIVRSPAGSLAISGSEQVAAVSAGAKRSVRAINRNLITASKDDYDKLPSHMRSLASWEDLASAVEKMNSILCNHDNEDDECTILQDEITTLGLGNAYVLLLLRMNRLVVERNDDGVIYRVAGAHL